jgi:hypothetical protein
MITQPIVEANLIRLFGNTRPEANAANDRGRVSDNLPMEHLLLQLKRPPARELALQSLIDQLHDPRSPNYHHWLSASEIGAQFGPSVSDIRTISRWLQQRGFTINTVHSNQMVIDFSGTAGQVRTAFHTDIHYLDVNGVTRFANMSDPAIPAALGPAVVGVTSLHDIPLRPMMRPVPKPQYTPSGYVCGAGFLFQCNLLTPPDVATIYNFNPLFAAGNTGQAQTIYLIEQSNLYTNNDWITFRSTFGIPVSSYPGASLTTINPGGCPNSTNSDDREAILDAEYASAAAPSAAIVIASCENLLFAIQTLVNSASPPAIMSISYGQCEATNGAASNQAFSTAYQTGVAEGMSIFVSAGDDGAAGCDKHKTATDATLGIAVSGLASTPYNVAVGGTDFSDSYHGINSTYWNSNETTPYGSALSYIPEIPWNSSCGSGLFASYLGFATTYGAAGLCNSSTASGDSLLNIGAGSGGPSNCATGSGFSCMGWPKPSWQNGLVGNAADGVRDLPDVSLFSGGAWGHFYIFCYSDANNGGSPCTGAPINWSGGGGTSFAAPIWGGIQALVNQQAGGAAQGNPNYRLYVLAAAEYTASGNTNCNANNGNIVGSSCIFYDVTLGDIDVPCQSGSPNCYDPSGTYGVLSTSGSSYLPTYPATTGWDFATGIGTVNVYNLVINWSGEPALQVSPSTSIAASGPQGGPFSPSSFSYTLSASSGSINFAISGVPSWLTPSATSGTASSGATVTFTVNASANSLAAGTYGPTAITFTNSDTGQGTQTRTATLTVNPSTPVLQVSPSTSIAASGPQGGPFSPSSFSYTLSASSGSVNYSITNVPNWLTPSSTSGNVSTGTTVTFTVNANANSLAANTYIAAINFANSDSGQGTQSRTANLAVNPPTALQVSPSTSIAASGPQGGPFSPSSFSYTLSASSGSINFAISGVPSWLTPSVTSGTASSGATVTFTVNASTNSLAAGTYGPTAITFTNSDTGQGTQTRTATLTVNPLGPALQVSPSTNITASGTQGGTFSPSSFNYTLRASNGSLNYSITNLPSWLTASPTSGSVTTTPKTITFRVSSNAHNLQPNTYSNLISFGNTTNGQGTTTRSATLTVNPKKFTVSVSASPTAEGTVSGGGTFPAGTSHTVTATPKGNHSLVHWTQSGKVVSTSPSYTFTMPSANVTLVADFH